MTVTVKDIIDFLSKYPENTEIILDKMVGKKKIL
jgi:hypothetical protein